MRPKMTKESTRRGNTQETLYAGGNVNVLFTSPLEGEDVRRTDKGETKGEFLTRHGRNYAGRSTHPALCAALSLKGRGGIIRGFTLIELLVVVLIIGILAAVALPQYNKAVMKAQVTEYEVNLKALAEAEQVCYLRKGSNCTIDELDIEVPECKPIRGLIPECTYNIGRGYSYGILYFKDVPRAIPPILYFIPSTLTNHVSVSYASLNASLGTGFGCAEYPLGSCPKIGYTVNISNSAPCYYKKP